MTVTAPTRITIEVHPPDPADGASAPTVVRVFPERARVSHDTQMPAAYDPGPCLCLDDEDCGADHDTD